MTNLLKSIHELSKVQAARFASLTYTNKHGETSRHTILLGASYEVAKQKDLQKLLILQPKLEGIKLVACNELIESMKKAVGQNEAYTCKGAYQETSIKGVKEHKETGELYLTGYSVAKVVLQSGIYPTVRSNEKTIAKNELRKLGRLGKIRQFTLSKEQLETIKLNGKTLEFK